MMHRVRHVGSMIALFAILTVVAAGCRRQVPAAAPAPPPPAPPAAVAATPPPPKPPPPPAPAPKPAPLTEEQIFAQKTVEQLNAERPLGDVFFDYDEAAVRADGRGPLQTNAEWLKRWSSTQITVEGHADSRGSSEYNLALGSRRATAVMDYLVNLGIPATRITVVSKGKEQPFCTDETEACWQQNRRGHFIITAK
jgi:peptidoglycan-associated lipoprotein